MDIHTSTPLVIQKQDTTAQIRKKPKELRQQLFQNNVSQFEKLKNDPWDFVSGPHFVDFGGSISDPHDSFFDRRKSDNGIPSNHLQLPSSTAAGSDSLINCLRNCSISEIESNLEDTTLKAPEAEDADNTFGGTHLIPEVMTVDDKSVNKTTERRQSTIVHPFTFEMREKEKQERKQARLEYKMVSEQLNAGGFRAKPAPKFIAPPKVNKVLPMRVQKETIKPAMAAPRFNNNVIHVFGAKPMVKSDAQPLINNVQMQIEARDEMMENMQEVIGTQKKVTDGKSNDQPEPQNIKPWQKKPFQVSLPKRVLTIPRSPKLLTAQRANTWKLHEERMIEKEKQELELRKRRLAMKQQRERDEYAEMRKKTVHKALPVPQYCNMPKRPPADPLNPIFIKRRRRI